MDLVRQRDVIIGHVVTRTLVYCVCTLLGGIA